MLCNGMAVQLYGAKSGHLKGFIDLAYQSPAGGYAYHNRGHIAVRNLGTGPGDSGALLTSGHDTTSPFSPAIARHYAPGYRKHLVCAALGMLVLGPSPTASSVVPADSVFVPIVEVLVALGIDLLCADDGEESP
jgi:hypothetical protein